ncbi:Uncharacterised protein [uncultured archaeon]|nr:Uncharacterised protein [uncultured archaeon]
MNSGVELAEKIGMTLVGFGRNPRLYVYVGKKGLPKWNESHAVHISIHFHRLQPCQFAQGVW